MKKILKGGIILAAMFLFACGNAQDKSDKRPMVLIKTQFGEYRANVEFANGEISYIRVFQLNKGKYPATDYAGFVDFFDKISNADEVKCVLVKI